MKIFDELISEAEEQIFSGWDFSFLNGRWKEEEVPWDYKEIVEKAAIDTSRMLDIGTGGGERLSGIGGLPSETYATEIYRPNAQVAENRLKSKGVKVMHVESVESLPFEGDFFDLVVNRHASIAANEIFRVLQPSGRFTTQQVGSTHNIGLCDLFGSDAHEQFADWDLENCVSELEQAGFTIARQNEAFPPTAFYDVGAVVFYLRAISSYIPEFSVKKYREKLSDLHDRIEVEGELSVRGHSFFIDAAKL